jgi:stage V sporulation protein K
MSKATTWLSQQLGPSPVVGLCRVAMTVLAVLSAFKVTPALPPGAGIAAALGLILTARADAAVQVMRLWPQGVGTTAGSLRIAARRRDAADDPVMALQRMTGLDGVKAEITTLVQRLQLEAARRAAGLKVAPL